MKKILLILTLVFVSGIYLFAQDDENGNEKIRDKMKEFIQKRLNLTRNEAEKFTPVFLRYFREWRTTIKENQADKLIMQQKIIEVRLRYRNEFKEIIGEPRSNEVYKHQDIFIQELRTIRKERLEERGLPLKRNRSPLQ